MIAVLRQKFAPRQAPSQRELLFGARSMMVEGAVAGVLYTIATNHILTGYLSYLGASVATCASIAMIPQLGCVLQFFSPFLFERLRHRKLAIWLLCLVYRFSVAALFLAPMLLTGSMRMGLALPLYILAFACAGIVTPGLQQWTLGLAQPNRRGSYLAHKDILATCVNGVAVLFLGRLLDRLTAAGQAGQGYRIVGLVCLGLAVLDALLLAGICEQPVERTARLQPRSLLQPLQDRLYRPFLLYSTLSGLLGGIASPFLTVYQLRILGLSHTFLASAGIVATLAGMVGGLLWGHYADRHSWRHTIRLSASVSLFCTLGWAFVRPAWALPAAPALMALSAAGGAGASIAGLNLQYAASPPVGKTLYIGFSAASSSIAACLSAAAATYFQPILERSLGDGSIALLFLLSGVGGLANLWILARRLPDVK